MNKFLKIYSLLAVLCVFSCEKNTDELDPNPSQETPEKNDSDVPTPLNANGTTWIQRVHSFQPAPGQFQNKSDKPLLEQANLLKGDNDRYVSLGTFGGYVVFDFGGHLTNKVGNDLAIFGNALENSSEPASVQVSYDANDDGKPNDPWYELKGSAYDLATTVHNYRIIYYRDADNLHKIKWKDNQGKEGVLDFSTIKEHHPQAMYPTSYADTVSFAGSLIANNIAYEKVPNLGPNKIYTWQAYEFGYADNKGYQQKSEELRGADLFDFSTAVNAKGEAVALQKVSFVRVYNPLFPNSIYGITILGERGPEIAKAKYLHAGK